MYSKKELVHAKMPASKDISTFKEDDLILIDEVYGYNLVNKNNTPLDKEDIKYTNFLTTINSIRKQDSSLVAWNISGHNITDLIEAGLVHNYYIYMVSDEPIQRGDVFVLCNNNEAIISPYSGRCCFICTGIVDSNNREIQYSENGETKQIVPHVAKKIIASTDKKLRTGFAKTMCLQCNTKTLIHLPDHVKCPKCGQEGWDLMSGVYSLIDYVPTVMDIIPYVIANWRVKNGHKLTKILVDCFDNGSLKVDAKNNVTSIMKAKSTWTIEDEELRKAFIDFACHIYDRNYGQSEKSFRGIAEAELSRWLEKKSLTWLYQ